MRCLLEWTHLKDRVQQPLSVRLGIACFSCGACPRSCARERRPSCATFSVNFPAVGGRLTPAPQPAVGRMNGVQYPPARVRAQIRL